MKWILYLLLGVSLYCIIQLLQLHTSLGNVQLELEATQEVVIEQTSVIEEQETIIAEQNYELEKLQLQLKEQAELSIQTLEQGWKVAPFTITAYAPHDNVSGICAEGNPNITATGKPSGPEIVAVNPKIVPYGSDVLIIYNNGTIEVGEAGDTGGALRKPGVMKIDVYRETYREASSFGSRSATVLWRERE